MPHKSNPYSLVYLAAKKKFIKFHQPKIAFVFYKGYWIDLLTTGRSIGNGHMALSNFLQKRKIDDFLEQPEVFHLSYEYGLSKTQRGRLSDDTLMGYYFYYERFCPWEPLSAVHSLEITNEQLPSYSVFKEKFEKVQSHLDRGDSYQVNLTMPFTLQAKSFPSPEELASSVWTKGKIGDFAHATFIPQLNFFFLSNTPECLFNLKKRSLRTMPIKGTIRSSEKDAWQKLSTSKKDQAELYMITDLLRNDFNSLGENGEVKVLAKKQALHVAGLIHQYSLIEKKLRSNYSLDELLNKIFPGGSITGAPKKRTMEIIEDIESRVRGLYTGSTLLFHQKLKGGSLNIRSALLDYCKKSLSYSAGGGITLLSNCEDEYDEMYSKWESFKNLL